VRSRVIAPSLTAESSGAPCERSWLKSVTITNAVQHRLAEERDEADRRRDREIDPGEQRARMPPITENGMFAVMTSALANDLKASTAAKK